MIITDRATSNRKKPRDEMRVKDGDLLDIVKINSLPHPLTARMVGGSEQMIETIDVQTGCMRLDIYGQIDLECFSIVMVIIDADGVEHDSDYFWIDYNGS